MSANTKIYTKKMDVSLKSLHAAAALLHGTQSLEFNSCCGASSEIQTKKNYIYIYIYISMLSIIL